MLQNAYFLAKIGADTAENEQHFAEICQKLATTPRVHYPPGAEYHAPDAAPAAPTSALPPEVPGCAAAGARGAGKISKIGKFLQTLTFANFWRARSRLYQNEILQENMR